MGIFSDKGELSGRAAPDYIEVGQIVNTHGVHGEVKVQPWNVTVEQLQGFQTYYIDGIALRPLQKRELVGKNMLLMLLPEIEDMDAAAALKGKVLSVRRSDVQLPDGEYFDAEIVGMCVYEFFPRRPIGVVEEVLHYPAHKLYRVRGAEHTYLIPAVQDVFIVDIDPRKREIYVKMMEGLAVD